MSATAKKPRTGMWCTGGKWGFDLTSTTAPDLAALMEDLGIEFDGGSYVVVEIHVLGEERAKKRRREDVRYRERIAAELAKRKPEKAVRRGR